MTEATCGKDGYTGDTYCNDCNTIVESGTTIPATGEHHYDEGVQTKDPTTTEMGEMTYTCTVCGDSYIDDIPMLEVPAGVTVNFVNYTVDGKIPATISVCGAAVNTTTQGVGVPATLGGERTFTVVSSQSIVVAYTTDGTNYTSITGSEVANTYVLPVDVTGNIQIAVVFLGDIDLTGTINVRDMLTVRKLMLNDEETVAKMTGLKYLSGDTDNSKTFNVRDLLNMRKMIIGS